MARIILKDGLKFELHGKEYQLVDLVNPGEWKILNMLTGQHTILSADIIRNFLFKGEVTFTTIKSQQHIAFPDLDETDRNEAIRREKYVLAILEQGINKSTAQVLEPIIQDVYDRIQIDEYLDREIKNKPQPSHITVYRWLKKYKQSEGNIHSLVSSSSKKGNRTARIQPEVSSIIQQSISEIYLNPNQASAKDAHDRAIVLVVQENQHRKNLSLPDLKIPNYMTTLRAVNDLVPRERDEKRLGIKTANLIHQAVSVGQGLNATRPLEIVAIDHSLLPFYVLDNDYRLPVGLPWLTAAIDVYSQTVVGYYLTFEPPSYLSVMYCLLHSIRPKEYVRSMYKSVKNNWTSYGLMENLKVDNGTDFTGRSLEDACRELKINLDFAPVRMPWYKAAIERHFGSVKTQLRGSIPGRCLQLLDKNDYDPKEQAVITLNELQEIIHIFIVDINNQDSHSQLKRSRAAVWNHAIQSYPISVPSSVDSLKVLLGDVEERVISKTGIEFYYLFYNSDRLQLLRPAYEQEDNRKRDRIKGKEKAKIKYNRNDLSVMHVFDPSTREYLAVAAINQEYTQNLSLAQHKIIYRYASNRFPKVDIVALALAKQEIQNIVAEALKETKAAKTSKQVIKFLGTGRGEHIIQAQEKSLQISAQADRIDDMINTMNSAEIANANSGLSDFSSSFDNVSKNAINLIEEMPIALSEPAFKESNNSKMISSAIETEQQLQITEKKATHKSKSKPTSDKVKALPKKLDRRNIAVDSELQVQLVSSDLSLQEDLLENKVVSAVEEEAKNLDFQSKGSIGLPKRNSRLR
jgi:putative transposase